MVIAERVEVDEPDRSVRAEVMEPSGCDQGAVSRHVLALGDAGAEPGEVERVLEGNGDDGDGIAVRTQVESGPDEGRAGSADR